MYFKSDLFTVPKLKEQEFRSKYDKYIEKVAKYEVLAKKLDLVIKKDETGLLELKH